MEREGESEKGRARGWSEPRPEIADISITAQTRLYDIMQPPECD